VNITQAPLPDILPPKLAELLVEHERMTQATNEAMVLETGLIQTRPTVEQQDASAAATALRAGGKDPGQRKLSAYLADASRARHRVVAAQTARDEVGAEVLAAAEAEQARLVDDAADALAEAKHRLAVSLAQLRECHAGLLAASKHLDWSTGGPARRARPAARLVQVDIPRHGDSPTPVDVILSTLEGMVRVEES